MSGYAACLPEVILDWLGSRFCPYVLSDHVGFLILVKTLTDKIVSPIGSRNFPTRSTERGWPVSSMSRLLVPRISFIAHS